MDRSVITPAVVLEIHKLRHAVTMLRLGPICGHDELWGALGAACNALEYAEQIARRDVQQSDQPSPERYRENLEVALVALVTVCKRLPGAPITIKNAIAVSEHVLVNGAPPPPTRKRKRR